MGPRAQPFCLTPRLGKRFGILAPAFETRPMPSRECRRLVEKEQLGVIAAPDVTLPALEIEHAANPLPRRPAPLRQCFGVGMETPAAVTKQGSPRGRCIEFTERIDAVLQRHCRSRLHGTGEQNSPPSSPDDTAGTVQSATRNRR